MPHIAALSLSPRHGFSKQPQPSLTLIANQGILGDAHAGPTTQHLYLKRKDPTLPNLCQVHLLASELLSELSLKGFHLSPGDLGENILTSGIDLLALPTHTLITFGTEANPHTDSPILEVTGLRTPCSQIDDFRPGLQQLLWGPPALGSRKKTRRAGIMSIVLRGGTLHPHDSLHITLPSEPHTRPRLDRSPPNQPRRVTLTPKTAAHLTLGAQRMNIREGARRIQVVGRIFLAFSIAALVFIVIVSLIANFTTALRVFPFALAPLLVLFTFYPGLIGTACLTIGWIVEGFATPDIPAAPTSIGDEPPFPANSSIPPMAQ